MNISRERKMQEAIKRMKTLGIIPDAIRQFKNDGTVMTSEPPLGALYWLNDEQKELVREFEERFNALVYMVVRSHVEDMKMDSFLFVSDYEEEWEMDNEDVRDGYAMTWTHNYDIPWFSEFGSIAVQERFGGLVRIA